MPPIDDIVEILEDLKAGATPALVERVGQLIGEYNLLERLHAEDAKERALAELVLAIDNHLAFGEMVYSLGTLNELFDQYRQLVEAD